MRRASRSASALTVVSISLRCSSLSLSQRLSSAWTKPLTPVSGERSSWATVATRSERSRSSRARPRPLRMPDGDADDRRRAGRSRTRRAVVSTSSPTALSQDCSGTPVRVEMLSKGRLTSSQVARPGPGAAARRRAARPSPARPSVPSSRAAWSLRKVISPRDRGAEDAVGVEVGQRLEPRGPGFDDAGHRLTLGRTGRLRGGAARRRAARATSSRLVTGTAPAATIASWNSAGTS